MWQKETWDPKTIDRELGWAADLGFNVMRVFLHDLAYQQDAEGFLKRMDATGFQENRQDPARAQRCDFLSLLRERRWLACHDRPS